MSVSHILSLIQSFENLKEIDVFLKNEISISQLWEEDGVTSKLFPTHLESFQIRLLKFNDPIQYISEDLFRNMNVSHLKNLQISGYYISKQTLRTIIRDLNLKEFGFSCPELNLNLLTYLADKHKDLNYLRIDFTCMTGIISRRKSSLFKSVRSLLFFHSYCTPIHFKQFIRLFPNLRRLDYHASDTILCVQDNSSFGCQICQNRCFDLIPHLETLRTFVITFWSIRKSFIQCLHRFPNLYFIHLYTYWTETETNSQLKSYDDYFKQICEHLIDSCKKKPKKYSNYNLTAESKFLNISNFQEILSLFVIKIIKYKVTMNFENNYYISYFSQ